MNLRAQRMLASLRVWPRLRSGGSYIALLSCVVACSAEVAPITVAPGCPEQPLRGPSDFAEAPREQVIDAFEHEGLALPRVGGRDGGWVLGSDGTSAQVTAEISDACAGRGERAGHFVGSGFSSWGANWTALMQRAAGGEAVPFDASPYGGISFWAAAGPDMPVPWSLPVGVTTMDVAWNSGRCDVCMDYYRTSVALEHHWQRFEVRFEDMAQSGVGDPLVALRRDQLVGVIFWPEQDFDLWLDDLRFEQ